MQSLDLKGIARRMLGSDLDPVPAYLLSRFLGRDGASSPEGTSLESALQHSRWVRQLAESQWPDGSWGRLHSRDSSIRQSIPTTEAGVERALALGLAADHPVMKAAADYLSMVLQGKVEIRDPAEQNDRWSFGVELFAASTLAHIQPGARVLERVWERWIGILEDSVIRGVFDPEAEIVAQAERHGISVAESYLRLSSRYALSLLSSRADSIPVELEKALFKWIWSQEAGIGYYGQNVSMPPSTDSPSSIELWLRSHELLAGFPSWRTAADGVIAWLLEKRGQDGYWDFGRRSRSGVVLPFSENWRRQEARKQDWSVRILLLLANAMPLS